ncbi:MAG: hypothetical protein LBM77_06495 [Spirochaetaceae bacterium]|jgi:capsule polysaccharide export protein KpsE/RkpR|nr:hypothetical protein [Spirochaetaceae bacterium]
MAFSDMMKDFLEQGAAKAQDWGVKGFKASKEFLGTAAAKAQDYGERGVLMLDIKQLENQCAKLFAKLGAEVYEKFAEEDAKTITANTPSIKSILSEIGMLKEEIEKKSGNIDARKKSAG